MPNPDFLSQADINRLLTKADFNAGTILFKDEKYVTVGKGWVENVAWPAFWLEQKTQGLDSWHAESNDCDDFTGRFLAYIEACHIETNKFTAAALGIGEIRYAPEAIDLHGNGGHSAVIVIEEFEGDISFAVIDAESGKNLKLSEAEKICDSISF